MSGIVIAGFAGVGKTTLGKKYKNVIDLESSMYRWDNTGMEHIPVEARKGTIRKENPNYPLNYINEIKKQMENYDIVLVWTNSDALKLYEKFDIPYILCYPEKDALKFYKQRYIDRGNNKEYIDRVINCFDIFEKEFNEKKVPKIILKNNETLEDYLIREGFKLIKR